MCVCGAVERARTDLSHILWRFGTKVFVCSWNFHFPRDFSTNPTMTNRVAEKGSSVTRVAGSPSVSVPRSLRDSEPEKERSSMDEVQRVGAHAFLGPTIPPEGI